VNELFQQVIKQIQDAARTWERCGEPEKARELMCFVDTLTEQSLTDSKPDLQHLPSNDN
jgi:hypothetical protein